MSGASTKTRRERSRRRMKMKGLMTCQSLSATAVMCSTGDDHHGGGQSRSLVMVPMSRIRRTDDPLVHRPGSGPRPRPRPRSSSSVLVPHHAKMRMKTMMNGGAYNRLISQSPPAPHHQNQREEENAGTLDNLFSPTHDHHRLQVVVMKVSIHCQGCAAKVKKHLSKMEGVRSFSIELESKRVTVMGHVSAAALVESISKVKKAQLWHAP